MSDACRAWKPRSNPWLIAVVVTLAAFMEVLDTTIVNVALPHISGAMSASYDEATWTLTAYLVSNGIVLPISGISRKLLGRKRYFLICIAAFTVCSLLCGLATDLWQLIVFRVPCKASSAAACSRTSSPSFSIPFRPSSASRRSRLRPWRSWWRR